MIWLMLALALGEPLAQGDAPILHAPAGSVVSVEHTSYLLREPVYDQFLADTKNLDDCEGALELSTQQCLPALAKVEDALTRAQGQFDEDEQLINDMKDDIWKLELKLEKANHQRNTAALVGGAILLGNVTALAVVLAL